jgi:hypothetical protein
VAAVSLSIERFRGALFSYTDIRCYLGTAAPAGGSGCIVGSVLKRTGSQQELARKLCVVLR